MARTFKFGETGIETMLTDEGSILKVESGAAEATVVEGNIATVVENPNYEPESSPQSDVTNTPTPDIFG